ncbi:hypothetical protein INR49_019453 [Caranx melampygus]|nr:hypothetical protein INR49_019453 [Caranx melampygus]
MMGMLSLCLVLWDRRRKPYSREYSTMRRPGCRWLLLLLLLLRPSLLLLQPQRASDEAPCPARTVETDAKCCQTEPHPSSSSSSSSSSFLGIQLLLQSCRVVVLQEDWGPTRVPLDLHPQDTVPRPALPHRLQTVDGRAGEGDVDVGEDEEDEERLRRKRRRSVCSAVEKLRRVRSLCCRHPPGVDLDRPVTDHRGSVRVGHTDREPWSAQQVWSGFLSQTHLEQDEELEDSPEGRREESGVCDSHFEEEGVEEAVSDIDEGVLVHVGVAYPVGSHVVVVVDGDIVVVVGLVLRHGLWIWITLLTLHKLRGAGPGSAWQDQTLSPDRMRVWITLTERTGLHRPETAGHTRTMSAESPRLKSADLRHDVIIYTT